MSTPSAFPTVHSRLRPALAGLFLGILTLLYGFGLGIAFGGFEDSIQTRLRNSAIAVKDTVYNSDETRMKPVLDKSWKYMQRAHLHAGGLGASSLALILVAALAGPPVWLLRVVSVGLGGGSLGYSLYWMWAGLRAPTLGGTGPAKESLSWLAVPSSGALIAGTVLVLYIVIAAMLRPSTPGSTRAE